MTKLSVDQLEEMAALRERGWSYTRLAARYGVSAGAIHYRCLTLGALSPNAKPLQPDAERRPGHGYGGRIVVPFSAAEDDRILSLRRGGMPVTRIADTIGRARTSTRIRLLTLELKADLP